ncbi:MAG: iron-containing alcohol dehydrogenase, partial [Candidatus Hodarchaeota archaeon]
MWEFTSPRKVIFGEDALDYLSDQEFTHAFIVTDPTMKKLHLTAIEAQLNQINTKITVFDEILSEPTLEIVQKGGRVMAEAKPDVIIALGGGSVLDAAKGMWAVYADPELNIEALDPFAKLGLREKTNCSLITIPTTSGTGADVTWAIVLTDTKETVDRKISLANRELVADVTILDPILTQTMPKHLIAGTGLDALSHAIDGYLTQWRNDISDAFARHAFLLIWKNLPIAVDQVKNKGAVAVEIREKLHVAASLAGWAFGNSQIILAHSLAHAVGSVFEIPHSQCVGTMCWYSLMFNKVVESQRIADLASLAGLHGVSNEELATKFIYAFKELLIKLDMPLSLKEMKITKEQYKAHFESLINYALNDSGTLSNPRNVNYDDI